MPLTEDEIESRMGPAQEMKFDVESCLTNQIRELCEAHANSVGAPIEFILFPLLSLTAHFMGPSYVDISEDERKEWKEPVILWNIIAADKGQKKSPALNRFIPGIEEMEEELQADAHEQSVAQNIPEEERIVPQITVEHFSFEELHFVLKRNNGKIVGLYDEVSVFYDQMDKHKGGKPDRKTFLSLYNGKTWK